MGMKKDIEKAIELWTHAGELGCAKAFGNIASLYDNGKWVTVKVLKAKYYYAKAAIMGDHTARHILAWIERRDGNLERAMKHLRIAAKNGVKESLESLRTKVVEGVIEQSEFDSILHDYEITVNARKSEDRDCAAPLLAKGMGCKMSMDSKNGTNDDGATKSFDPLSKTMSKLSKEVTESWNLMKRK
ncbi:hypothetical protein ACHAXN_001964 [Cyclotella atomus]